MLSGTLMLPKALGHDIHMVPNMNHNWILNGGLCVETGAYWNNGAYLAPWLHAHLPAW